MLYILTGNVQCGKTHWLTKLVDTLSAKGVCCSGVLAPGRWDHDGTKFVKRGFNNLLLPSREVVEIAIRADLKTDKCKKFNNPKNTKKWLFDDNGIHKVNEHFHSIYESLVQQSSKLKNKCSVYVVDELGPIELEESGGLTWGVKLLEDLPRLCLGSEPTAFVIVRENLVDIAKTRFNAWKEQTVIDCNQDISTIAKTILSNLKKLQ